MTERLSSQQIEDTIRQYVADWEDGKAASPSARDFAGIIGQDDNDELIERLYDYTCHGADESDLAAWLWTEQEAGRSWA